MAGRVLFLDELLGILELPRVPSLPSGPFDIRHDSEADDIVFDDDAISLRLICFDLELLDGIDELASEVEPRHDKSLVFVSGI